MKALTTKDIEAGYENAEWLGFGYLGERRNRLTTTDPEMGTKATRVAMVKAADRALLKIVNEKGWTADELFAWLNSKNGRWYGDAFFGCGNSADLTNAIEQVSKWNLVVKVGA